MAVDLQAIFGIEEQKPDDKVSMAMILQFLTALLKRDSEDEMKDEREQNAREIPVRPRVEPLGGA